MKERNPFTPAHQTDATPKDPTVTHFHSFFYDTFTWKYPRTTGLLFASSLAFLLLGHYVNILRYAFKGAYITFAATAAFEYLGRPTTGTGFMTQVRPQRYYTIPRENLEMVFAEIHEFLNFIVLEFQRVIFVENLTVTMTSFVLSLIGYFLVKFMPIWSLLILADVLLFTVPLVYLQNQELIDHHINQASVAATDQIQNARNLAEKHTADYSAKAKTYANDLTGKLVSVYQDRQKITKPSGASVPPQDRSHVAS
ncbi:Reticulon-2 [Arthrobotrys entomopaga]|nr:Reticulon-2 [Arthrobotrys entomopaga]